MQATHSKKNRYLQKKVQKKVLYAVFRNFSNFEGVFKKKKCIFFSQEKFKIHSLTQIQNGEKKKKQPGEKKKNRIFTHSVDFFQNVVKIKLFREKKNTVPLRLLQITTLS